MKHITIDVDAPELHIYPIGDVQVGAHGVAEADFRAHIVDAIDDPFAHFFGIGDYTDSVSPSNRKVLRANFVKGALYDTPQRMIDEKGQEHAEQFLELVRGTEGRWDALLGGHHLNEYFTTLPDGTKTLRTTDHDIAEALLAPFLGVAESGIQSAIVSYRFPATHKGGRRPVLRMYAVHGQGGGGTFAGPLNQLEKMMRAFEAQIYLVGHHHKSVAAAATKLREDPTTPTKLIANDARIVSGGSWLRGYMPNEVSYAEDGLMVPLAIGAPVIYVTSLPRGNFKVRTLI